MRYRWLLLLLASCIFYMVFIPVYILILAVTIVIDYSAGLLDRSARGTRKTLHAARLSIAGDVPASSPFSSTSISSTRTSPRSPTLLHWNYPIRLLAIILPIGLSFHTFQGLSYDIEVYRGHQPAERHFGIYALYVMFFPQLVAGPIERPQNMLHQFHERPPLQRTRASPTACG